MSTDPSTTQRYRTGPAIGTVLLCLSLLALAGVTLWAQLGHGSIAYAVAAPYALVGAGLVLAAIGALAAIARRRPPAS